MKWYIFYSIHPHASWNFKTFISGIILKYLTPFADKCNVTITDATAFDSSLLGFHYRMISYLLHNPLTTEVFCFIRFGALFTRSQLLTLLRFCHKLLYRQLYLFCLNLWIQEDRLIRLSLACHALKNKTNKLLLQQNNDAWNENQQQVQTVQTRIDHNNIELIRSAQLGCQYCFLVLKT